MKLPQMTTRKKTRRGTHEALRIPYPQTPESAHEWLRLRGITVKDFAHMHGLKRLNMTDVLLRRSKGNYGKAHRAAVALGIKPPVESNDEVAA